MSIRFGAFTLDPSSRQLLRGEEVIHLSPKGFQLLTLLIERRPTAVAKSDLQEAIWPATFVTESNLASLIAELRTALADDPRKPQFIRTLYGFGYAFSGEASEMDAPSAPPVISHRRMRLAVLSATICLASLAMKSSHPDASAPRHVIDSIAILPFKVSSSLAADEYLGLGIADVITTRLSNVREMSVRPTSSVARYGNKGQDPLSAGERLGVDAVLDGTVRRSGNRIRVSVQLFTIRDSRPVWGHTFDENFTETFKLEDAIAGSVASALELKLTRAESRLLAKRNTEDSDAYRSYVIGRYQLVKTPDTGWKESIPYFEAAIRQDPSYALAYAGLANAYIKQAIFNDSVPSALWQKAADAAQRALALDDELSEAHDMIAVVHMTNDWNWRGAEEDFKRAISLNPSNSLAHRHYAMLLESTARFDEAVIERKRAIDLDPLSPAVNRELAFTYYLGRRYDDAIRQQRLVLAMDPNFLGALIGMGQPLVAQQRFDEAIASYTKALAIDPQSLPAKVWLARAEALAGRHEDARRMLAELEVRAKSKYIPPYHLATIYLALGQKEEALNQLEIAADQHSMNVLRVAAEPAFDAVRSDRRYIALVHRIGLD